MVNGTRNMEEDEERVKNNGIIYILNFPNAIRQLPIQWLLKRNNTISTMGPLSTETIDFATLKVVED